MRHLNVAAFLSACQKKRSLPRRGVSKTVGDQPKDDTPIYGVHAEGHFRRRRYPLKMLLSGQLVGKEFILTDQKTESATFFLFGEGQVLSKIGRFCPGTQFSPRNPQIKGRSGSAGSHTAL